LLLGAFLLISCGSGEGAAAEGHELNMALMEQGPGGIVERERLSLRWGPGDGWRSQTRQFFARAQNLNADAAKASGAMLLDLRVGSLVPWRVAQALIDEGRVCGAGIDLSLSGHPQGAVHLTTRVPARSADLLEGLGVRVIPRDDDRRFVGELRLSMFEDPKRVEDVLRIGPYSSLRDDLRRVQMHVSHGIRTNTRVRSLQDCGVALPRDLTCAQALLILSGVVQAGCGRISVSAEGE
jgi:hypothetical protein